MQLASAWKRKPAGQADCAWPGAANAAEMAKAALIANSVFIIAAPECFKFKMAQAAARAHLACAMNYPHLARRLLIREAIKRVRRRITVIGYEMMDEAQVQADVDAVFSAAADALTSRLQEANASDLEEMFASS